MSIKISVVVPTYKRPALLSKCLQSLLRQNFLKECYEIIIVSDGPDDQTRNIVQASGLAEEVRIRFYELEIKKGPAAARNLGWQNAKGELVAFTDDDCIADSSWLENFWSMYSKDNKLSAFTGKVVVPVSEKPTDYQANIQQLEHAEFVTANCACAKVALQIIGGFDEQFSMAWREDTDLQFKLIQFEIPIYPVAEAVIVHPVREAPWGVSIQEQKKSMFNALLYKKYPRLYRQRIQPNAPWLYYGIVLSFFVCIITALIYQQSTLTVVSGILWLTLTIFFAVKRLIAKKLTPDHIAEMIVTSLVIPFLSLFWRFYGSVKFRTLLI